MDLVQHEALPSKDVPQDSWREMGMKIAQQERARFHQNVWHLNEHEPTVVKEPPNVREQARQISHVLH